MSTQARVIVTGAANGIGKAIAQRFVADGAKVLLADNNEEALIATAASLGQPSICIDVRERASIQTMVERAVTDFGGVDTLVNNAGIFRPTGLLDLTEEEFDLSLAINLKSVLFGIQAVTPVMSEQGGGAIVNIASVAAMLASPLTAAYCSSKAAVVQLTNAAAIELAPLGIRVNAVGPGTIRTDMAVSAYGDPDKNVTMLSRTPMGRSGLPEEIAGVVAFLAGKDSTYVTGKTLYVDGGRLGLNLTVPVADT
jgi:NAD(P)-dependent dehydrogenase (short-subunit alcohol dehydrogenase family)